MDLHLNWGTRLRLTRSVKGIYDVILDDIPEAIGIYIFFRIHGNVSAALYIGKADNLRLRVTQQLNTVRLMKGIENARTGNRYLIWATFKQKQGQQVARCLRTIERALIRHYLSKGDELLNVQGAKIRKHSLTSERTAMRKFIPKKIYFEG
jgi:hypothetical protein